jgi:hypothetical protein
MAGLVPAIHVLLREAKTWMPGTRPGMMTKRCGFLSQLWLFHAFNHSPARRDIKLSRGTHLMHLETVRSRSGRKASTS